MADPRRLLRSTGQTPVPPRTNRRPWYKENPPSMCFIKHNNKLKFPTTLNSQQWIFVREGQDDFRNGCPPSQDPIMKRPREGFLPLINHRAPHPPKTRPAKLPREATLTSRLSAARQARMAFVEQVEARLARHPLAPYPNLGDLPVELLSKVLEVLDPDRQLEETWAYCENAKQRTKDPTEHLQKPSVNVSKELPKKTPVSSSKKWVFEEQQRDKPDLIRDSLLFENVRKEVHDFCDWATSIGSAEIDEEYILKQFDLGYMDKPSSDMLHEVGTSQVPLEQKSTVRPSKPQKLDTASQERVHKRKPQKPQKPDKEPQVKMRYGAWYLDTKLWKRQRADEPLVDPQILLKAQKEKLEKEKQEQKDSLQPSRVMAAFKDFIISKGYRMPSFLEKISTGKECKKNPKGQATDTLERIDEWWEDG